MKSFLLQYNEYFQGDLIEVLFMFQSATVWPSTENIYNECIHDTRFRVTVALCEDVVVERGHLMGARKYLEDNNISYVLYSQINFDSYHPHCVFFQLPYDTACHTPESLSLQFVKRGIRVVYIPYGNEIADSEVSRRDQYESFVVENCWRLYTGCEPMLAEYQKYCRNRNAVRCFGASKYDSIYCKEKYPLAQEIVEKAGERKIIVWKIHFPKKDNSSSGSHLVTPEFEVYFNFLEKIEIFQDMFFVVLAHPKLLCMDVEAQAYRDDTQMGVIQTFLSICKEKGNVHIDTSLDYRNTLYNADAVIMDRSGLIIEIALLNIPALFMKNKEYEEPYMPHVQEICNTYFAGTTCQDIVSFLENFRDKKDLSNEERRIKVKRYFPYLDGQCSKRIIEDIINGLSESRTIPRIVFYGNGSVCTYYMENQNWSSNDKFEITAFIDSDSAKWGQNYYGYKILPPGELVKIDFDAVVITTEMFYFDIKKYLVYELFIDERKIYRLDEFIVQTEPCNSINID